MASSSTCRYVVEGAREAFLRAWLCRGISPWSIGGCSGEPAIQDCMLRTDALTSGSASLKAAPAARLSPPLAQRTREGEAAGPPRQSRSGVHYCPAAAQRAGRLRKTAVLAQHDRQVGRGLEQRPPS